MGRDAGGLRRARAGQPGQQPTSCCEWCNEQVGKTQRLSGLHFIDELPRSAIGKVLKRELRERHVAEQRANKP